ncbi:MAG: 50S ribosomal protein L6 [Dehalococcoidia bacterium]|nr:50S ribosomal protein L6 [Dehalococcoidia bacterium]
MSHIGKLPVVLPPKVKTEVGPDNQVTVTGPLGTLTARFRPEMNVQVTDGHVTVQRSGETKLERSLHGLTRALINNMVLGVTKGYQKDLEITGTGYRVSSAGDNLTFLLGYSHPVLFKAPAGIKVAIAGTTKLSVTGCDKQQVGQVAAQLRALRPPDSYKGKGVRYAGEVLRLKPGKAAARKQ